MFANKNRTGIIAAIAATCLTAVSANASQRQTLLPGGAVYTMTNSPTGNAIAMYERTSTGGLVSGGTYRTGGLGTGVSLGNQGGIAVSPDNEWLLTVNAGSNQVSLFRILGERLLLTDVAPSGGTMPISVTVYDHLVYVLNAGGTSNISGLYITSGGRLVAVPNSTRSLSTASPAAAQIGFAPNGTSLVVTEKGTNNIDTFQVDRFGNVGSGKAFVDPGSTPFGFSFDHAGHLFVTEAYPGITNASATSSFNLSRTGTLGVVSATSPTHQTAACWAVTSPDDKYVYVANAASSSISGYSVSHSGALSLLNASGVTAGTVTGPTDLSITPNGRFLYVLKNGGSEIGAYKTASDGSLTAIGSIGVPAGSDGLVAW